MSAFLAMAEIVEALDGPDRAADATIHWHIKQGVGAGYAADAPAYTASLDDAMKLVPEGHDWGAGFGIDPDDRQATGWAWCGIGEGPHTFAATPALALTAACLKTRSAEFGNIGADGVQS